MFEGVLPDVVRWAVAAPAADPDTLLPAERAAITSAAPARAREFAAGRAAARAALEALGHPPGAIPVGTRRRPVWPDGVTGSITHCRGLAAAAAARTAELASLGIDAEPAAPLDADVHAVVVDARDRLGVDGPLAGTVAFCAKEAFYKCWSMLGGELLEFHDVALEVHTDGDARGVFTARPDRGGTWPGRWAVRDGFVLAASWQVA